MTSFVLPAAIKMSVCTFGNPGNTLPSSATIEKPGTPAVAVIEPTMEGTCMRKPAFTKRSRTVPVTGAVDVPGGS